MEMWIRGTGLEGQEPGLEGILGVMSTTGQSGARVWVNLVGLEQLRIWFIVDIRGS